MTNKSETLVFPTSKIACVGDATFSHPRVFLAVRRGQSVRCPYCNKLYTQDKTEGGKVPA